MKREIPEEEKAEAEMKKPVTHLKMKQQVLAGFFIKVKGQAAERVITL